MKIIDMIFGYKVLWETHTPQWDTVGKIIDDPFDKKKKYIRRIIETTSTKLINGGTAPCFEVWGKEIK
jgi:hypothetical protein